ncbi:MAG: hypothetical protein LBR80_06330 [Deltaproteobacteria bacterium]|nr:hypothetical protein [Deltaproteobacteria bacterium]
MTVFELAFGPDERSETLTASWVKRQDIPWLVHRLALSTDGRKTVESLLEESNLSLAGNTEFA